jgi:hypothetical protein
MLFHLGHSTVMAGLVPAIHVFLAHAQEDVDARDKRGHDEGKIIGRNLDLLIRP